MKTPAHAHVKVNYTGHFVEKMTVSQAMSLEKLYGITEDDYIGMLEAQNFMCACCGSAQPSGAKGEVFVVDHCHETGEVRGLLCGNCNRGIGLLGDNFEGVRKAVTYLLGAQEGIPYSVYRRSGRCLYVRWTDRSGKIHTMSLKTNDRDVAKKKAESLFGTRKTKRITKHEEAPELPLSMYGVPH